MREFKVGDQAPVAAALAKLRPAFFGVAAISGITNILMLTGPLFMLQIYDRVLSSRSVPTLVVLTLLVIALYLFLGGLEIIRARVLNRIGCAVEEQLGGDAFLASLSLPLRGAQTDQAPQPVRDLDQLRNFMSGQGPIAICDLPWLPVYIAIVFLFHPYLGLLAVLGALVLVGTTLANELTMREPMQELSGLQVKRGQLLEAGVRNAEALAAMGMRGHYANTWHDTNHRYLSRQSETSDRATGYSSGTKVFRLALQSMVLALGAWLAIQQLLSPGAMIAASILTARALAPIEMAVGQWKGFIAARQAYQRLSQLLTAPAVAQVTSLPAPKRRLAATALSVAAPGKPVPIVQAVQFDLNAGQGLGIIGPSGSGKSSLARALTGVWPIMRGSLRLDGAELDQWPDESLGASIGYLPQDVELFAGTVAQNIARFQKDVPSNQIIDAAQAAGAHEMILSLADGYDTEIGISGAILSAGQRQRVGLARALFGNPFLIVLDEPNSNLDADGDTALNRAIMRARDRGAVIIVVAHRPSGLVSVDQLLVLAQGRQVAFGPREEVLRQTTQAASEPIRGMA